jgi:hypothetical protein
MVSIRSKAILPSIPTNPRSVVNDMTRAAKLTSQQIRRDFERTVRTWERKPKFIITQKKVGNAYVFSAYTDNEIYGYVNDGTKPHVIRAKNAPFLTFNFPSVAKTSPGVLSSKRGSKGSSFARVKEVQHPGTEARKFDEIIQKRFKARWQKEANRIMRNYLNKRTELK